jgi:GDP-L-fucose synthase
MDSNSRIYLAGHRGLVGSAIRRSLERQGFQNIAVKTHAELDLTDRIAVNAFFQAERPEYVFLAAAKVGGILANNTYPADFIRENLEIQNHVIDASYRYGVDRLVFLGSTCFYPKLCPQPIKEEYLLTSELEPTNRPYALAKIAGLEMCWAYNRQYGTRFLATAPTNLYGPGDNYNLHDSHVLPALIRKVAVAKATAQDEIVVWGTGTPRRELLYSDDMADACVFLINLGEAEFASLLDPDRAPLINIGTGEDLSIRELAELVCQELGFDGKLVFDTTKPDGTPRKLTDSSRIQALGWRPKISLADGIRLAYEAAKAELLADLVNSAQG